MTCTHPAGAICTTCNRQSTSVTRPATFAEPTHLLFVFVDLDALRLRRLALYKAFPAVAFAADTIDWVDVLFL